MRNNASIFIAVGSLIISILSVSIAWRTYSLLHRPFVGVTIQQYRTQGNPPTEFLWKFALKNAGHVPAWERIEELHEFVTQGGQTQDVLNPSPLNSFFLMPEDSADITGRNRGPSRAATSDQHSRWTNATHHKHPAHLPTRRRGLVEVQILISDKKPVQPASCSTRIHNHLC